MTQDERSRAQPRAENRELRAEIERLRALLDRLVLPRGAQIYIHGQMTLAGAYKLPR